jgi:hypothetical protein
MQDNSFAAANIKQCKGLALFDELLKQALDLILSIPWLAFESRCAVFLAEDDQVLGNRYCDEVVSWRLVGFSSPTPLALSLYYWKSFLTPITE